MAAMPEPTDDADLSFDTLAVHAGAEPDELTGAVAPPIYQTSTFEQDGVGKPRRGYEYARSQNPDPRAARARDRDAGRRPPRVRVRVGLGGHGGDRRARPTRRRGGRRGRRLWRHVPLPREGPQGRGDLDLRTSTCRPARTCSGRRLSERTRLVWFETPSNPLLKIVDIAAVAETVERRAAEGGRRPLIVVDNTFASPAIQRPLTLGADIVFHSATKYLAGHSDTILGLAVTSDDAVAERLALPPERDGRGARAAGLLPRAARAADTAPAGGAPPVECHGRRRVPARAAGRGGGQLPGDRRGGLVHGCAGSDAIRGRAGDRDRRGDAPVHPGRVAGRRGVADRGPGRDDPHVGRRARRSRSIRRWSASRSASKASMT